MPLERAIAALSGGGGRRPPQARAAEEIARLDLEARQEERPLAEPVARRAAREPDAARRARPRRWRRAPARGCGAGYACFKVKVGLPEDAERVAAVREAIGPWPALRVDANRAWSVDEAVRAIRDAGALRPRVRRAALPHASTSCAEVRGRVSTPIAADESVGSARAVRRAVELEACDVVNVKLAGAGGFKPAREALRLARSKGLGAFLSSTLDGPWGSPRRCSSPPPRTCRWPAGSPRSSCSTRRSRARCPRPRNGTLQVPGGPGTRRRGQPGVS